ncbi:hypothetical protein ATCC90586_003820 [Pythium insidiosum]|nr:hypothetical protein ATCC90586_003820 [Pythium insidiosum]
MEEKVRVAIRVRTPSTQTQAQSQTHVHTPSVVDPAITSSPDGQNVLVYTDATRTSAASFRCETFLPCTASQDDVFTTIGGPDLVQSALDGFPVTVFAYGQTGAGKSYTIFGKEDAQFARCSSLVPSDGVLPRVAQHLMAQIDDARLETEFTVRVTCVEIYNEQVRDLFDTRRDAAGLSVRQSKAHGVYLENATVVQCRTAAELIRVVKLAASNRVKSSHLLNDRSNRSHCLVTIYIDAMPRAPSAGVKRYGKLTIVDLAGSERANDTGAVGQQLRETGHINKSLYCLSQVIQAMAKHGGRQRGAKFVPYRDSKLTMLLIDSLGGNCKTLMLACVNGATQFATESIRTLEFAMGVAKIKNRPTAVLNPHEKLISDLKEEIRLLKLENMMLRSRTPGSQLVKTGSRTVLSPIQTRHAPATNQSKSMHASSVQTAAESETPLDPAAQVQRLLQQMMVANDSRAQPEKPESSASKLATTGSKAVSKSVTSLARRPSVPSAATAAAASLQFDDARAQDLFQQLCRL